MRKLEILEWNITTILQNVAEKIGRFQIYFTQLFYPSIPPGNASIIASADQQGHSPGVQQLRAVWQKITFGPERTFFDSNIEMLWTIFTSLVLFLIR